MTAPLPPADLATRTPNLIELDDGVIVHRFYSAAHDPIFFDRSLNGRLNAAGGGYGVLYAAARDRGAFAETFLRTPGRRLIDPGLLARKAYVTLRMSRPVTLIDFDGPGLAILGATAEVVHGGLPYDVPQAWSEALKAHPVAADGIAYSARHDPHETCYALFDSAADAIAEEARSLDLDTNWFWELAEVYKVGAAPR